MNVATELDQVVEELRAADRLLLTTHENPDGDALGSLVGCELVLRQLGKDVVSFMSAAEFPLPYEYRWMTLGGVRTEPPADVARRLVVFLDCGNIDRMPVPWLQADGRRIVNVDHHHDNTRFGDVNLVDPGASCTAELVWRIAHELGAEMTLPIAEALYVALVTDTGRFMYENTTPEAHRMAAELIEAGVEVHEAYRHLYEQLPERRLHLLARALGSVRRYDEGLVTLACLTREDFFDTGSEESDSEGVVDHLRSVQGTAVAVLVRELLGSDRAGLRKVSLRAVDGRVDVSRIARALGGGGHRQAAGATTELELEPLAERIRGEVRAQLGAGVGDAR